MKPERDWLPAPEKASDVPRNDYPRTSAVLEDTLPGSYDRLFSMIALARQLEFENKELVAALRRIKHFAERGSEFEAVAVAALAKAGVNP